MVYFQQPGVADAELDRDRTATFRRVLSSGSGGLPFGDAGSGLPIVPPGGGFLDLCPEPASLPAWLSPQDIDIFAAQYADSGFTGPLNWYRNLDRNWELTGAWHHASVLVPALYVAGEEDLVLRFPGAREGLGQLAGAAPRLREPVLLPGCGHWTQQERPEEVNAAVIGFLRELA
jgi:pimeloyl-ACP methyl ester carboxylesterase